jgi:SHS2 domain-containing protein
MQYRYLDHTADIGIAARGSTLSEALEALLQGLLQAIVGDSPVQPREERRITVEAEEQDECIVDFLNEVLFIVEARLWLPAADSDIHCEGQRIEAVLRGEPFDDDRHEMAGEVKAATYHDFRAAETEAGWEVQVIFDV